MRSSFARHIAFVPRVYERDQYSRLSRDRPDPLGLVCE